MRHFTSPFIGLFLLIIISCLFFCQSEKSKSDRFIQGLKDTLETIAEKGRIEDSIRRNDPDNLIDRPTPLREETDQLEELRNKMVDLEKKLNNKK